MINNINQYLKDKKNVHERLKYKYLNIRDFDIIFNDAFLDRYPVYEKKFDSSKDDANIGRLQWMVEREIWTYLKKMNRKNEVSINEKKLHKPPFEMPTDDKFDDERINIYKKIIHRGISPNTDWTDETEESLRKIFNTHMPLVRLAVWSIRKPLTSKLMEAVTEKIKIDSDSENHFKWKYELSIVRLGAWLKVNG